MDCAKFGGRECNGIEDNIAVVYVLLMNSRPVDAANVKFTGLGRDRCDG